MSIVVLPEIEKVLFPLSDEEFALLEKSILEEGIRDDLVVWHKDGQQILVDGHHRYKLAQKHGLEFNTREKHFESIEEAIAWVDQNQLARRNLTVEQRLLVLGRMYERRKKVVGRPEKCAQNEHIFAKRTAEKIASLTGVSQATVRRAAEFTKAVDAIKEVAPEAAEKILKGEVKDAVTSLPKVAKQNPELLHDIAEEIANGSVKKVKEAASAARKKKILEDISKKITENNIDKPYKLFQCDIRELTDKLEPESIDAIITDPPYPKEYLPLYEDLAKLAARVLKPGGSLLVMTGQSYLPEVMCLMEPHMRYHWALAYLTPGGQAPQIWPRKVNTFWKPVLWFVKDTYNGNWIGDVVRGDTNDNDKRFHEWGQSESGMIGLIERFSKPGDLILDPFLGGGTTGVVAIGLGRRFIGTDINPEILKIASVRLSEVVNGAGS